MQRLHVRAWLRPTSLGAALMGALLLVGCGEEVTSPSAPDGDLSAAFGEAGPPQDLGPALAAQRAHSERLMALEDVVGTAVGIAEGETPSLVVYLTRPGAAGVPDALDGVPVKRVVTGRIDAISDPTSKARPAPLGFSVGHPDITAGTYGARVTDGSDTYLLSNNHVIAASNDANLGDPILQPGPHDGGTDPDDRIGTLDDYQAIDFSGGENFMDAAVALPLSPDDLSASTPTDDAYGAPSSTAFDLDGNDDGSVDAGVVGLAVKKYGRTTELTHGEVAEISVQISVCYEVTLIFCTKSATFVDQLGISGSSGDFSAGGDSGSLIVTGSGANPVGLLFAGGNSRTFANRIDLVLDRFGVSVDDGSGEGDGGGDEETNASPTASFTASCAEDLSCDFDGSGSSDSDGTIASYDWDFGDGATGTGSMPSHTYAETGTYTVTLTVTDDEGATGTTTESVKVGNEPPTADFISLCSDLSCAWDGNYSSDPDGTIESYHWDLGDGTEKTGDMPSHTYAADGTYTVVLTVTDDQGATDSKSEDVTVSGANEAPSADFTHACTELTCEFTDESTDADGSIASWSWDFGDGSEGSTAQHPNHTYGAGGTYTVSLTVTDDEGATDTSSQDVSVSEATESEITLTASGQKAKRGMRHVDLSWSGATSTNVDIYRDGDFLEETPNDGEYQDSFKGGGSATYQVCEAGTSTCSESVTVSF